MGLNQPGNHNSTFNTEIKLKPEIEIRREVNYILRTNEEDYGDKFDLMILRETKPDTFWH